MEKHLFYKIRIEDELARRCEKNPHYSMRAFAQACGIAPGVLSMILSGKRIPSYKLAQKLMETLELSPNEQEQYLTSLATVHKNRGLERLNPVFRKMKESAYPAELSIDLFRVIGDWQHYAILMLTYTEGFKAEAKWIGSQLGIPEVEVKLAIERLKHVGLVVEQNGKLVGAEGHITTADKHITTPALKRHAKQSLEKAVYSLENDPLEMRSMTYMTMAINPKKIEEAKTLIEAFTNQMSQFLEVAPRSQVYEFGVYLYPLQKQLKKEKS